MKPAGYDKYTYRELPLNTCQLEVIHNSYQQGFRPHRDKRIACSTASTTAVVKSILCP